MDIRKISIGVDYKSGSMHYVLGQSVISDRYVISCIKHDSLSSSFKVYIEKDDEIFLWKEFNKNVPVSIEYNINFI